MGQTVGRGAPVDIAGPRLAAAATACATPGDGTPDAALSARIGRTRELALTRLAAANRGPTDRFPHSAAAGATAWSRRPATEWTAGFYPASLWAAYRWTHDPRWLTRARTWTTGLLGQATNTGTHDLGFMLDTNAGRGATLDPSEPARGAYAEVIRTAARTLASRWNEQVGAIRSAEYGGQWVLIVDSAMNMDLLFHAASLTSDPAEAARLRDLAHRHLLTLARDAVRPDGSTVHRLTYDPVTGALLGPIPGQGLSTTSTWTRGQAWAISGFTMGYRNTGDTRLLDVARRTAELWATRIGPDCVPPWDFDAPPEAPFKDTSAGAVAATGLLDLAAAEPDPARASADRSLALAMLAPLTSPPFTTEGTRHPAVLRRGSYSIPRAAVEASYVWGDYYLIEAMSRALPVLRNTPTLRVRAARSVPYGGVAPVTVTALLPGREPSPGVTVSLLWQAAGRGPWQPQGTAVTGPDGAATWKTHGSSTGRLRAVSAARLGDLGGLEVGRSALSRLTVTISGGLTVSERHRTRYVLRMSGVASPVGTRLALQERGRHGWVTLRRVGGNRGLSVTLMRSASGGRSFRVLPLVRGSVTPVPSATVRVPRR